MRWDFHTNSMSGRAHSASSGNTRASRMNCSECDVNAGWVHSQPTPNKLRCQLSAHALDERTLA
jgi:hypothetical protein